MQLACQRNVYLYFAIKIPRSATSDSPKCVPWTSTIYEDQKMGRDRNADDTEAATMPKRRRSEEIKTPPKPKTQWNQNAKESEMTPR